MTRLYIITLVFVRQAMFRSGGAFVQYFCCALTESLCRLAVDSPAVPLQWCFVRVYS